MELNEILKIGDHIYSILHGIECEVTYITPFDITLVTDTDIRFKVNCDGSFVNGGECIIFPSKENRNWKYYKKFDINTLQPFDKLLVRDGDMDNWAIDWFSHIDINGEIVTSSNNYWDQIIPYNEETEYLRGTDEDCPKYYNLNNE